MEAVILLGAVIASLLVFFLPPMYGLIVYIGTFAWFPPYLTVKMGTLDFTICRIVMLAIYANLFLQTNLAKRFKLILLDKLIILYFLAQIVAGGINSNFSSGFLENRAGVIFDTLLAYFVFRMIITTKNQYIVLVKGILLIAAPLALVGFYQCLTGDNPFGFLRQYNTILLGGFQSSEYVPLRRGNFFRADVTFSMSIMFGLFFAMLGPAALGIIPIIRRRKNVYIVAVCLMAVGVLSSMSSGPILALMLAVMFIGFYRFRRYWKPVVTIIIIGCGIVEIISNRHFYDIFGRYTFSPATAWYRSRLIDVALFEGGMSGYWLTGYGFGNVDPDWGSKIDGNATDIVNHYILILYRFGLIGLIPFLAIVVGASKALIEAYQVCTFETVRWLIWCLAGALFGVLFAMNSTSLFGQAITVFYILLALCGSMSRVVRHGELNKVNNAPGRTSQTTKRVNNGFIGVTSEI
jgi:hypothetical protein